MNNRHVFLVVLAAGSPIRDAQDDQMCQDDQIVVLALFLSCGRHLPQQAERAPISSFSKGTNSIVGTLSLGPLLSLITS